MKYDRSRAVCSAVFAFLLGLSFVLGRQIDLYGMTLPGYYEKVKIILCTLLLTVPLGVASYLLFAIAEDRFTVRTYKCRIGRVFIAVYLLIVL